MKLMLPLSCQREQPFGLVQRKGIDARSQQVLKKKRNAASTAKLEFVPNKIAVRTDGKSWEKSGINGRVERPVFDRHRGLHQRRCVKAI
jgi:hypothetical protein